MVDFQPGTLNPCMKLHQNGTVSFSIRPALFWAGGWAETLNLSSSIYAPGAVKTLIGSAAWGLQQPP